MISRKVWAMTKYILEGKQIDFYFENDILEMKRINNIVKLDFNIEENDEIELTEDNDFNFIEIYNLVYEFLNKKSYINSTIKVF